ncbi:MAG: hypothetical protein ACM3U2_03425 [Deltaproteobacteria bacterium]
MQQRHSPPDDRPEFMVYLELLPPYSIDDVHKAYKAKALAVHPDRGGSTADFLLLQKNYGRAQEYVRFQEGRRNWLATQVEPYLRQQEIIAEVERRGGRVEIEILDWMKLAFGDFATLAERLRGIRLQNSPDGDACLQYLAENASHLPHLSRLDLAGSAVTNAGLKLLLELRTLDRINLAGTAITGPAIKRLAALEQLEWLDVSGISIGRWTRWRLRRLLRDVEIVMHARS